MNRTQLENQWLQMKGKFHQYWGRLSDDDLIVAQGNAEILEGMIAQRYALEREIAKQKLNAYLRCFNDKGEELNWLQSFIHSTSNFIRHSQENIATTQDTIKRYPLTSVAAAVATGLLLGKIFL